MRHDDIRRKLDALEAFCLAASMPEASIQFEAEALAAALVLAREVGSAIGGRLRLVRETVDRQERARLSRERRVRACLAADRPVPVAGEPDDGEPFPLPWQVAEVEE
jgi:hypothetical protein